MAYKDITDEELVRQIQLIQKCSPTDETTLAYFEELYHRYYQKAYNLARFYGLEKYDAEDVVQDAFLKLLLHVNQFHTDQLFRVWFMKIVFNVVRDKFREKKRHGYHSIDEMADTLIGEKQNFLERFHFQDEVQRIINRMPEKIRMVVILRVYGEMEFEQISQILHVSVRQVHNRMKQAVAFLKEYGKEG